MRHDSLSGAIRQAHGRGLCRRSEIATQRELQHWSASIDRSSIRIGWQKRKESEVAWKVTALEVKARGYNLDFKNPHTVDDDHGDAEEVLQKLTVADAQVADLRDQLKSILAEALLR